MGVFKEEANFLEGLARRQHRIWQDSMDYGIRTDEMSKGELDYLRETIKLLLEMEGNGITWKADRPATQRKYHLEIIWSDSTGDASVYDILYYKDRTREFFSIDISRR